MADVHPEPCPKCGGACWDNRATKRNPRAPDGKCKNDGKNGRPLCDGVIWPPKPGQKPAVQSSPYAAPALPQHPAPGQPVPTQRVQSPNLGNLPGWAAEQDADEQQFVQTVQQDPAVKGFFDLHAACVEEVLDVEVPMLKAAGVAVTAEAVSALAAQLFIALTNKVPGVVAQRRAA